MEDSSASKVMELLGLGPLQMSLKAAIELKVLEILHKAGPESKLSASQIAAQLPTTNPTASTALDRILSLLASNSILSSTTAGENGERLYGLTPICKYFVSNQDGASLAPLFLFFHDKVLMESLSNLKDCVLEGSVPFDKAFGMNIFDYLGADERFRRVFSFGLYNHSITVMRDLLENYKGFEGVKEVVDVGGGIGASLKMIVSKYPHIKGTNFDLPHVIADAPSYPGVKHVSGDMFERVPNGDAIFMKFIFHAWDDKHCEVLLKNCWNALPEHGKVIMVEFAIQTNIENNSASRLAFTADLMMLAYKEGGKERTIAEFEALAKRAGFATMKAVPCSLGMVALELHKRS